MPLPPPGVQHPGNDHCGQSSEPEGGQRNGLRADQPAGQRVGAELREADRGTAGIEQLQDGFAVGPCRSDVDGHGDVAVQYRTQVLGDAARPGHRDPVAQQGPVGAGTQGQGGEVALEPGRARGRLRVPLHRPGRDPARAGRYQQPGPACVGYRDELGERSAVRRRVQRRQHLGEVPGAQLAVLGRPPHAFRHSSAYPSIVNASGVTNALYQNIATNELSTAAPPASPTSVTSRRNRHSPYPKNPR